MFEKALKIAIENGYRKDDPMVTNGSDRYLNMVGQAVIVQDPLFWKALGRGLGWGEMSYEFNFMELGCAEMEYWNGVERWKYESHRYFETLMSGNSEVEFWEGILK